MLDLKTKIKIYLDTSVISALFDDKNPERKSLTEEFFANIGDFEVYVSNLTMAEIEKTTDEGLKDNMLKAIEKLSVLELTGEDETLAKEYIAQGGIPENFPEDAYHIAVAACNSMEFILSWNYRHIVRRKTKDVIRMVNTIKGYPNIEITTPGEML